MYVEASNHIYQLPFDYAAAIFEKINFLSMYILPWVNILLDFVWALPNFEEGEVSEKMTMKIHAGLEPTNGTALES